MDLGWCKVNIFSKFQLSCSNGWKVMMFWRFGGKGLIYDEAVCRTVRLATLGLFIIVRDVHPHLEIKGGLCSNKRKEKTKKKMHG